MNGQTSASQLRLPGLNPQPKSVFINQLDGGYTLNLQGNQFYPTKVCVTLDEVKAIINDFFTNEEAQNQSQIQADASQQIAGAYSDLLRP